MSHKLFLSHDSRDHALANVLATTIERLTLRQIVVWRSSDPAPEGGLRPGSVWLDEIREHLATSKAVVVLLTPTSVGRPWLYFESGFGAGQARCDVIPVCVGISSSSDVPFPLAMYQAYQLSDYESLRRFAEKLLAKYEIVFDEQMSELVLEHAVSELSHAEVSSVMAENDREATVSEAVRQLKEHIDSRLVSLLGGVKGFGRSSGDEGQRYDVAVQLSFGSGETATQFVEIGRGTSVQDVLNHVYFMLRQEVEPRTYLEQWVLRDMASEENLIVREIQARIPAATIFTRGSKWEVIMLAKPYMASESIAQR